MFHSIYLRTGSQATEDPEKVRAALRLFFPEKEKAEDEPIHETITSGHYGNPITVLEAETRKKQDGQYIIDLIKQKLGQGDVTRLISELPLRVDEECNLYIRFDKQQASMGNLVVAQTSDTVLMRIKLKAYPAKQEKAIQVARDLFKMED